MSKYYQEFQTFLQNQILNLENTKQIQLNPEQREKITKAVETLWLYDLRKIASGQKYYSQIIENVFNSISQNRPVQLIQFTCTKRNKFSTDLGNYVQREAEGSNLLPNLPFLQLIKTEFEKLEIELEIVVLLADSENYWVDLQEGKYLQNVDLISILKPQWQEFKTNLEDEINLICNQKSPFKLISTSDMEKEMSQNSGFYFGKKLNNLQPSINSKFSLKLIARMSLVWQSVLGGGQRNAFADAENEISTPKFSNLQSLSELQNLVPEKYIDITLRQLAEYALQGQMLEKLLPQAILLQNERPVDEKNYFYNIDLTLRKEILPEICPYFYQ